MKNIMKTFTTALALIIPTFASSNAVFASFDMEAVFPEVHCMALNVYYETRSSNMADQYAVADVTLNRMYDTRYPNSVCKVVKQGHQHASGQMKRNACQFSWYCDGKADKPMPGDAWVNAQTVAWNIMEDGMYRGLTEGATHYHADYVEPRWAKSLQLVGRIGAHIFYRWEK